MTKRVGLLIDTKLCIGCRACQVSCKEWNELPAEKTVNRGSFENPADISESLYNRIRFIEKPDTPAGLDWHFFSQRCMHCGDAGCVKVCPSGALSYSELGTVAVDRSKCIACNYCRAACVFDIPRYDKTGRIAKCHLCTERVVNGIEPACSKTCPTGAIRFGAWDKLLADAKATGREVYGADDLDGLGALFLLEDSPASYTLPAKPAIPAAVGAWKDLIRPLGWLGFWGALGATLFHYITIGPKNIVHDDENGGA